MYTANIKEKTFYQTVLITKIKILIYNQLVEDKENEIKNNYY